MKGSRSRRPKDDLGPPSAPPPAEAPAAEKPPAPATPAPPSGLRCPFCKGELAKGALGVACAACGTLHHPGCFAEHHGCSTHGCESTRGVSVVVGAPPPPPFSPLACARCRKACPGDAIVARCTCGRVQHTACYEQLGRCAGGRCQGQVELLPHRDAVHERLRERSGVLFKLGLSGLLLGGGGGWLIERLHLADTLGQADARALMLVAVVLALAGLLALYAGLGVRRRARAVATLPPRARADDAVKQLEKELGLGPG